jgi:hypothetical protein
VKIDDYDSAHDLPVEVSAYEYGEDDATCERAYAWAESQCREREAELTGG